jgi:hypothetical protein
VCVCVCVCGTLKNIITQGITVCRDASSIMLGCTREQLVTVLSGYHNNKPDTVDKVEKIW